VSNLKSNVRVRFAPSPTGYLHVGGARTALYNFLFARQNQGSFIVRVEDTDQERSTEQSLQMVLEDLQWLGLQWDEGPVFGDTREVGDHQPYRQSRRLSHYKKVADEIFQKGLAYYCFLTDEEIEVQREAAKTAGKSLHLESPYEKMPLAEALAKIASGEKAVVRFKTKHLMKDYQLQDLIRGTVTFPSDMVSDFVLLRSDGMPVYNFCCAVDDHEMQISHVLRAEEHLPNTLRQMMIYESMKWPLPKFGHISLVLDENRQKLSKRRGATSCHEFKNEGFLPEALLNYVSLLGWSHPNGNEIISIDELIKTFSLERLNSSGAIFDVAKLRWVNATHLRAKNNSQLLALILPFLQAKSLPVNNYSATELEASVEVFKPYMETLVDGAHCLEQLYDESFSIHEIDSQEALSWETSKKVLQIWQDEIKAHAQETFTEADFLKFQEAVKVGAGVKGKNLFMPLRVAVLGKPHGTELKILVPLLKKKNLLLRVEKVLAFVGGAGNA
jgi:nondiscriminating glutamyl-tRNA synthetase